MARNRFAVMRLDLDGRRALVTGVGSGIGAAIVELLRTRGAAVVGVDKEDGSEPSPSSPARTPG